jgi:hypothetical protein
MEREVLMFKELFTEAEKYFIQKGKEILSIQNGKEVFTLNKQRAKQFSKKEAEEYLEQNKGSKIVPANFNN